MTRGQWWRLGHTRRLGDSFGEKRSGEAHQRVCLHGGTARTIEGDGEEPEGRSPVWLVRSARYSRTRWRLAQRMAIGASAGEWLSGRWSRGELAA
jgi:hypothetical protein